MPETPNHSYNVPDEGASDWHEPLNENFRQYDTDIEIRDEAANRSEYQPVDGAKFLATDTGVVYVGDGSNWVSTLALAQYRTPSRSNTPGIAFGYANNLNGEAATISGGGENSAGPGATISGGVRNTASGGSSTIGGGADNEAMGQGSVVVGGSGNRADGGTAQEGREGHAMVLGGQNNTANGSHSLAAGREATANKDGAFVWADGTERTVQAERENQMLFQAGGGVTIFSASDASAGVRLPAGGGSWSSLSAASAKSNVQSVDPQGVLEGVESLDIGTWEYDAETDATHMGPMAGEFHEAFGLGADADRIATVDADGVALATIQGMAERLEEKDDRIDDLEDTVDQQRQEIEEQADAIAELEARLEDLESTD